MSGIRKAFPGVQALDGVDLEVRAGEVHVLLGENGAGKSTLMQVLAGACQRDAGTIDVDGRAAAIATPRDAQALRIAVIQQELQLVPELSVAENVLLGRLPHRFGVVDHAALGRQARAALAPLDPTIDVRQHAGTLRLGAQQLVEIARALSMHAQLLVLDEPTSALTDRETARLFDVLRTLTARGVAVIYISHRLDEIFAIGDRVTVLRDGRSVATMPLATTDRRTLIRAMTDRDVSETTAHHAPASATSQGERLSVRGLSTRNVLHEVSLQVHAGEIVGVAGLLGAGRTEVARAIFGIDRLSAGTITVDGRPLALRTPRDAIAAGIGFLTEDRKREGLLLDRSVQENVALPVLRSLSRWGVMRRSAERALATRFISALRIRTPSAQQSVRTLSGGNQQKVVLAKWLATGARVLLLDEPTRGVDVGAKEEMHALIRALAHDGVAVLLLSSDLPELLALANRTYVMRDGRVAGELRGAEQVAERVMALAVGA
jgi:ABC-type sugar transport system ATPase subunit